MWQTFINWLASIFAKPTPVVQPPAVVVPTPAAPAAPVAPVTPELPGFPIPDNFINAIIIVESGSDDNAHGDLNIPLSEGGSAYGCMQIRQGVCDDVNAHFKTSFKASDCLGNRDLSIQIFCQYWQVHTSLVTDEDRAKGWNGGAGWKQYYGKPNYANYTKALDAYWAKVQKYL